MRIFGLEFSHATVDLIREAIRQQPGLSRRALSRRLCESVGWHSPNGQPKELSCRKALLELDRRGLIQLPERSGPWAFQRPCTGPDPGLLPALPELEASLDELGPISVQPCCVMR